MAGIDTAREFWTLSVGNSKILFFFICKISLGVTGHLKMHHQFCLINYFYNNFSRV